MNYFLIESETFYFVSWLTVYNNIRFKEEYKNLKVIENVRS